MLGIRFPTGGGGASAGPVDLGDDVWVFTHATEPTSGLGGTGDGFAGRGSLCIALDTGVHYHNYGDATTLDWRGVLTA